MKITHFMFAVLFGLAATFSGAVLAQDTTDTTDTVVIQDENGTEITTETTTDGTETTTTVEETVAE